MHSRRPNSLQTVWAWWLAGVMAYIPANLYPMMSTKMFGAETASTIVGGAIELLHHHAYFVAFVVLAASVAVPIGKFAAIAYLALSVSGRWNLSPKDRLHLYEIVEYIGRWSMIDIFVVAVLASLVQLGAVASIAPGPAAGAFALSVIFTMLSARAFDPRLLWDADTEEAEDDRR